MYEFPVEGRVNSSRSCSSTAELVDAHPGSTAFPLIQGRAGSIRPRFSGFTESPKATPLSCHIPSPPSSNFLPPHHNVWPMTHSQLLTQSSGDGTAGGVKSPSRGTANGSAPCNLAAYVHGEPQTRNGNEEEAGGRSVGGAQENSSSEAAAQEAVEDAASEYRRERLPFSSICSHTRLRMSLANGHGGLPGSGNSASRPPPPQLMYRQDTVEEVTRTSPVISAANSPFNSRRVSSQLSTEAIEGDDPRPATRMSAAGGSSAVSPLPAGAIGVSTSEMADYYSTLTTTCSGAMPSGLPERMEDDTSIARACVKAVQTQSRVIQALQHEVQVLQSRNRLLEERVLRLELYRLAGHTSSSLSGKNARKQTRKPRNQHSEEAGSRSPSSSSPRCTSSSPSVARPSDTLTNDHCLTRAPSSAA